MTDISELTEEQLKRAIPARLRRRLMEGRFESGQGIAALRTFVDLTQAEFARAIGIRVHTLRNWERDEGSRRDLRSHCSESLHVILARIIGENLESAA
jgi:DNA-binding transcriptional regulator YiaG